MQPNTSRRTFLTTGAAATVGITTLAGCTSRLPGVGNDDPSSVADEIDQDSLGDREASEEVEIDFWLAVGAEDLAQEMADDFAAESDTISVDVSQEGDYNEVYNGTQQAQTADDPPEIVHLNAVHTLPASAEDVVVPVGDLIDEALDTDDFVDAVGNYYVDEEDDVLLGLPFAVSTVTCSYNVDAFEDAGLETDPDSVPLETFEEWTATSEALVADAGFPQAVTWPTLGWFYESFMSMQGQEFLNNDNGRSAPATEALLDTDAVEEIYAWNQALYEDDYYLNSSGWGDARQAFLNEEAAVLLDSSSNLAAMADGAAEAGFEHEVGAVPHHGDREGEGLIIGGGSLFVPTGVDGPELEAAAEFLLWLSEPEQQARWHMETGYYPTSLEAEQIAESEGFYDEFPQFQRAFQQLTDRPETTATAGALTYDHGEVRDELDNGLDRLLGGDPLDDVLESMKDDVDAVLDRASADDPRA